MNRVYDCIIIGAGPAGITAGIYAKRAQMDVLLIEQNYMCGGQILNTYEVDNYPGMPEINGFDLGLKFKEHLDKLDVPQINADVNKIETEGTIKKVHTSEEVYETKTVVLATGADYRKLNIPGENELRGKGVSYCATCDGAFFKNKTAVVNGGGDVAVEDAIYLSRLCSKVYLIHRRDSLRAAKVLQEKLLSTPNIEVLWNTTIKSINGTDEVKNITIYNKETNVTEEINTDAVFIAIGMEPRTALLMDKNVLDSSNYVIAGEDCTSKIEGIYAVGDIRTKNLRQIVTAISDGANVVTSIEKYLNCL